MKFQCECGQTLRVSEALVGEKISCPGCHRDVSIPDPEEVAARAEAIERAKKRRKKVKSGPSVTAGVFHQVFGAIVELLESNRTLLIRGGGFIFGPVLLLVFSAIYFKPVSITNERLEKIQPGMTLKQVEGILGHTHSRYRDPSPKQVVVNYSKLYGDGSGNGQPDARLWHDGWFVTGNNPTRSVFVSFNGSDAVSVVMWRELNGTKVTTHIPFAKPGSVGEIEAEVDGPGIQFKIVN